LRVVLLESLKTRVLSPKLKLGEVVPYLELPANKGTSINLWDFKQRKNLVLFFHHGVECGRCVRTLKELAEDDKRIFGKGSNTLSFAL